MELTKETIFRAWKDESFRESLPEAQRNAIPARPTGKDGAELSDAELEQAAGGTTPACAFAIGVGAGVAANAISDAIGL